MIPSSSSFSRVIPIMPSKANRERLKAEKEERRRLGRERANKWYVGIENPLPTHFLLFS